MEKKRLKITHDIKIMKKNSKESWNIYFTYKIQYKNKGSHIYIKLTLSPFPFHLPFPNPFMNKIYSMVFLPFLHWIVLYRIDYLLKWPIFVCLNYMWETFTFSVVFGRPRYKLLWVFLEFLIFFTSTFFGSINRSLHTHLDIVL